MRRIESESGRDNKTDWWGRLARESFRAGRWLFDDDVLRKVLNVGIVLGTGLWLVGIAGYVGGYQAFRSSDADPRDYLTNSINFLLLVLTLVIAVGIGHYVEMNNKYKEFEARVALSEKARKSALLRESVHKLERAEASIEAIRWVQVLLFSMWSVEPERLEKIRQEIEARKHEMAVLAQAPGYVASALDFYRAKAGRELIRKSVEIRDAIRDIARDESLTPETRDKAQRLLETTR